MRSFAAGVAMALSLASVAPLGAQQGSWAFVDVTVIPMDREGLLPGQTVVVTDGVITGVGPSGSVDIPGEATRIDGSGRYLMPGLAEMHAHVPPQPDPPPDVLDDILFLYVANGVTTNRGMPGARPSHGASRVTSATAAVSRRFAEPSIARPPSVRGDRIARATSRRTNDEDGAVPP